MTARTDVLDLVGHWAAAEQDNDAEALDKLLAGDFVGVGPLGFVLDRDQWLGRFGNGLENRAFAVEDAHVRDYGAAAVVVGRGAGPGDQLPGRRQLRPVPAHAGRRAPHRPLAAGQRPVGAENPVHLTRPGHTRGSAHRYDRAARPVRRPPERAQGRLPAVAPEPSARCGRCWL
jgi:hypothetical protein